MPDYSRRVDIYRCPVADSVRGSLILWPVAGAGLLPAPVARAGGWRRLPMAGAGGAGGRPVAGAGRRRRLPVHKKSVLWSAALMGGVLGGGLPAAAAAASSADR